MKPGRPTNTAEREAEGQIHPLDSAPAAAQTLVTEPRLDPLGATASPGIDPTGDMTAGEAAVGNETPGRELARAPATTEAPIDPRDAAASPGISGSIVPGAFIGKGAMGVVVAGRQEKLGREVAIKRVSRGTDEALTRALRQEAIATGMLEHPNIVPVHDLVERPEGPWMVMKRVRGQPWGRLLANPDLAAQHLEGNDPLEFHIGVLMSVCRALSYAHENGVLHRDVKPDNIMVGEFGQVYLMDWGLAVALREIPGLPLASELRGISGTPSFMAPEMARGVGAEFSEQTDVYLLGANLHFLLTGRGVHLGPSPQAIVKVVREGAVPTYGPEVPAGLAAIARRCLAKNPEDRPVSAECVRRSLAAYLRHRAAEKVLEEAQQRAEDVKKLVHEAFRGHDDPMAIRAAIAQARFGFELVSREWPEQHEAAGLEELIELSARYELHRRNPEGAATLLEALADPPAVLLSALEDLQAETKVQQVAVSELFRLRRDADPTQRARYRVALAVVIAGFTSVGGVGLNLMHWFVRPISTTDVLPIIAGFSLLSIGGGAYYLSRQVNRAGRDHTWMLMLVSVAVVLHWFGAWLMALPLSVTIAWNGLLSASLLGMAAVIVDRGLSLSAVPYLFVTAVALLWPDASIFALGVGSGLSFAAYALLFLRRPRTVAETLSV